MNKGKKKGSLFGKIIIICVVIFVLILIFAWLFGDEEGSESWDYEESDITLDSDEYGTAGITADVPGLRAHYVDESTAENVVIMVYMIGSDLESESGCASSDIDEMLDADLGEHVQIVLQTGGASEWMNDEINPDLRQRWLIDNSGMQHLEDAGSGSMTEADTLTDFVNWTAGNYEADRYMLIFWDHGGGTMGGFGYDEVYDEGALSLADMSDALGATGVKFNVIGFDACLMATIETAYTLEAHADYLIASEEYEPGDGWYYADFLSELGADPKMKPELFGKAVIDSFAEFYDNEDVTLSLVDLREVPNVYEKMSTFFEQAETSIQQTNSNFQVLSKARSSAREYCDGSIDQVDILDVVDKTEFEAKDELEEAIRSCVKYYNNSSLTGSYGLAMYFPYSELDSYDSTRILLDEIGFTNPTEFYNYFLSIMAGGQSLIEGGNSAKEAQQNDYSEEDWFEDFLSGFDYGDEYEEYEELYLEETDNGFELEMTDEMMDLITDIQLSVMIGYEDGSLDLGNDNITSWTEDGNLLLDFDYTWVSVDGIPVAFYADKIYEDEENIIYSGRVPAVLNGDTNIELVLEWDPVTNEMMESDDYSIDGHVMGYRIVNEDTTTQAKGLFALEEGDTLSFLYDWYDSDGVYDQTIESEDTVTVTSQDELLVSYEELEDYDVSCWYTLIDIYQNEMYTETIEYTVE